MNVAVKTEYQYINFYKYRKKGKRWIWSCRNNHSNGELGRVRWHSPWRQYCYFPTAQAVYSGGCLEDIQTFIKALSEVAEEVI